MFAIIFTLIVIMVHFFIGRRIITPSGMKKSQKAVAWVFLYLLSATVIMAGLILGRAVTGAPRPVWLSVLSWVSYVQMGMMVLLFLLLLLRDVLRIIKKAVLKIRRKTGTTDEQSHSNGEVDLSRRKFMVNGANLSIIGLSAGLTGLGAANATGDPVIEHVEIKVPNLPEGLNGFRLVQVSDLHIGPTLKRDFASMVVDKVNSLNPDIIAVTGDLIDGLVPVLENDVEPFKDFHSKFGTYYVSGNHEYYWGVNQWFEHVSKLGMRVLNNKSEIISTVDGDLLIGGVNDYDAERFTPDQPSSPVQAIYRNKNKKTDYKILLAHQPRSCFEAQKAGFDLQLSGHTHGGQFVPWNYLVRLQQPFVAGLDKYKNMLVYTNRGTGYWGPPLRLGVPSEITLITLVS